MKLCLGNALYSLQWFMGNFTKQRANRQVLVGLAMYLAAVASYASP